MQCFVISPQRCEEAGGFYRGDGTDCSTRCPQRADVTGSGDVTIEDYFAYINHFFAGDLIADTNRDGVITIDDYLDFLGEFFRAIAQ